MHIPAKRKEALIAFCPATVPGLAHLDYLGISPQEGLLEKSVV